MDDKSMIIRVSAELHRAFKVKCAQEGTNMNTILNALIESYVRETKPKKK